MDPAATEIPSSHPDLTPSPASISDASANATLNPSAATSSGQGPAPSSRVYAIAGGAGKPAIYGGTISTSELEPNEDLRGDKWYGSPTKPGMVARMMRDPYCRASVRMLVGNLLHGRYDFEAPKTVRSSQRELADELVRFSRWQWLERVAWKGLLAQLLRAAPDGFSIVEIEDANVPIDREAFPNHPGGGFAYVYTRFHHRPASTITRWRQSKACPTHLESVTQQLLGSDTEDARDVEIPASRFIRLTFDQEGANFPGLAVLRSASMDFKNKVILTLVQMMLFDRAGAGVPSMELPEGSSPDEYRKARQILEAIRAHEKNWMTLLPGMKFDWNIPNASGIAEAIDAAIRRCNEGIFANVDAQFLSLGASGKGGGSHALAEVQKSTHQLGVETRADELLAPLNFGSDGWSPIKRSIAMNYGEEIAETLTPRAIVRNLPSRDISGRMKLAVEGTKVGMIRMSDSLEEWALDGLDAPPVDETSVRVPRGNFGTDGAEGAIVEGDEKDPEQKDDEDEEEQD